MAYDVVETLSGKFTGKLIFIVYSELVMIRTVSLSDVCLHPKIKLQVYWKKNPKKMNDFSTWVPFLYQILLSVLVIDSLNIEFRLIVFI